MTVKIAKIIIENLHKKFAKFVLIMYNIYKESRRGDLQKPGVSE